MKFKFKPVLRAQGGDATDPTVEVAEKNRQDGYSNE